MRKLSALWSLVFGMIFISPLAAQQIPVFTQYVYNPSVYNPSYSGQGGNTRLFLAHRQQWMGFEDAPNSTLLSGHVALGSENTFGLGGVIIRDANFVNQRISLNVFPSVHLDLATNQQVSFGINLGVINHSLDFSQIQNTSIPSTQVDPLLVAGENTNELHLDTGLGINYQYEEGHSQVRLGAALSQLSLSSISFSEGALFTPYTHLLINASARFALNQQVLMEPMFFFKQTLGNLAAENGNGDITAVTIGGGELDGMLRVAFPEAENFWFGLGTRLDVGTQETEEGAGNSSWAFSGAVGVDIGEQLHLSMFAEAHQYLPFSLELGLSADLGGSTASSPPPTIPTQEAPVIAPPVAQVEKQPKTKTPKTRKRKSKTTKQEEEPVSCDPLWRHSRCLEKELESLTKKPSVAEVLPIIAANEVILIYKFSDKGDQYMLNRWDRVNSLITHIQSIIVRLRAGQEPLTTLTKIQVTGKISSSAGLLQTSSRVPYSGEFGGLIEANILLDGVEESFSVTTGNITRKQLLYLKQLSLAKAFASEIVPEFKVLSGQDIKEDWEFSIELRISR